MKRFTIDFIETDKHLIRIEADFDVPSNNATKMEIAFAENAKNNFMTLFQSIPNIVAFSEGSDMDHLRTQTMIQADILKAGGNLTPEI